MEIEDAGTPSGPLALFCARLKRLQVASGITQASLTGVAHLGRTQMVTRRTGGAGTQTSNMTLIPTSDQGDATKSRPGDHQSS
jgi:hypothetical protein